MNAPIPVSEALTLLSMAIEDCDRLQGGQWVYRPERDFAPSTDGTIWEHPIQPRGPNRIYAMHVQSGVAPFLVLARATMRPMLEAISTRLRMGLWLNGEILDDQDIYLPLAALRDHYDRTRPDWRTR